MDAETGVIVTASSVNSDNMRTSPAKPEEIKTEAEIPDEGAQNGSSIGSPSLITEEMLKEEEKLHTVTLTEEEKMKDKIKHEWENVVQDQQYRRLQHLLEKSNIYISFLLKKMEKQKGAKELQEQKKKERENRAKNKADQPKPAVPSRETRSTLRSNNKLLSPSRTNETRSSGTSSQESQDNKGVTKQKRGRKRKFADNDSEQAKKYKFDESVSGASDKENPDALEISCRGVSGTTGILTDQQCQEEEASEKDYASVKEQTSGKQPTLMTGGTLRTYQIEGYEWLKLLYENGINGILADEMGLGKTVQCIALLSFLVEAGIPGPFLIAAPLSTLTNWVNEFKRFSPTIPVILYHGTPPERQQLRRKFARKTSEHKVYPIVVTSYEITMNDRKFLQHFPWRYLIIDEGHRIKNLNCRLIKELKMYQSTNRLLLTGTPLQNNLAELWSLLNFLLPEIFDDLDLFESWFDFGSLIAGGVDEHTVAQEQEKQVLGKLHQILTPFVLRRLKADVELFIPPKKEVLVYAPLTVMQSEFYSATVNKTIGQLLDDRNIKPEPEVLPLNEKGRPVRQATKKKVNYQLMLEDSLDDDEASIDDWVTEVMELNKSSEQSFPRVKAIPKSQITLTLKNSMMVLRKICNHPYLLEYPLDPVTGNYRMDEDLVKKCGKMLLLDRMLAELKKKGHKVLIFSQMTKLLDIIQDYCCLRNYPFSRLDGSMRYEERGEQMEQFRDDPDVFIFLLSTRAGGLGINLTAADTVIIYDSDWNPQCDLQAQDRCHRIGQTKPVVVFRLVTADTIDQKIIERAAAKRKLEKMVMHKGKFKGSEKSLRHTMAELPVDELLTILQSSDHAKASNKLDISDAELQALLDRSDIKDEHEKRQKSVESQDAKINSKLFKVIQQDDGASEFRVDASDTC